jgi:hypothetical protein
VQYTAKNEYGALIKSTEKEKPKKLGEKSVLVPLCLSQLPHMDSKGFTHQFHTINVHKMVFHHTAI